MPAESPQGESSSRVSNELLEVLTPRGTLLIAWLLLLLCSLGLWAFWGHIPITTTGLGMVLSGEGVSDITSLMEGTVVDVRVQHGQVVHQGELVMRIYDPRRQSIWKKYQVSQRRLAMEEALLNDNADLDTRHSLHAKIESLRADRDEAKEILLRTHYVTTPQGQRALSSRWGETPLESFHGDPYVDVVAPMDMRIISVKKKEGLHITPGDLLFTFEEPSSQAKEPVVFAYFPLKKGDRIHPGMRVEMQVYAVDSTRWGSLIGHVIDINPYPVSRSDIDSIVPNVEIAEFLMDQETAVLQAKILPQKDPRTKTGYAWTSGHDPNVKLTAGTVVQARVIVELRNPVYYVLPIWRDFTQTTTHYPLIKKP